VTLEAIEAPRVFTLVWSRAHHDRRTRESVFLAALYAPGWRSRPEPADRSLSRQGVIVALSLALLGIAMAIYLTLFLAQPPDASHAMFARAATGK
jgi:hypothetical protein